MEEVAIGIIAEATKRNFAEIRTKIEKNLYFNSQEALDYGIIDGIVKLLPLTINEEEYSRIQQAKQSK
jgi:ATP-dependent protease ClpP protease subunit